MLLHACGLVRMEEDEARLAGDGVPQERAQLVVGDEVDELVRVGEGVPVVGRENGERVAAGFAREGPGEVEVEERGLHRVLGRSRSVDMGDAVDPGPVRVHVRRRVALAPLEEIA